MGYTTDFTGAFEISRPLAPEHANFLHAFNQTRRMKRRPELAAKRADSIREAAGLEVGPDGGYFVGSASISDAGGVESVNFGQERSADVADYNESPEGQPGLWCQWVPTEGGTLIEWDGGEKFYAYVEWLRYLVEHFLAPWGYTLSGEVEWIGEDSSDRGKIVVAENEITVKAGRTVYDD